MADIVQWRGANEPEILSLVGRPKEITVNTTRWVMCVHDGITPGGIELGAAPEHRWVGSSLQFKNADRTWGTLIDLTTELTAQQLADITAEGLAQVALVTAASQAAISSAAQAAASETIAIDKAAEASVSADQAASTLATLTDNIVNVHTRHAIQSVGGGMYAEAAEITSHDAASVVGNGTTQTVLTGIDHVTDERGGMVMGKNSSTASDWSLKSSAAGMNIGLSPNLSDPGIAANLGITQMLTDGVVVDNKAVISMNTLQEGVKSVVLDIADAYTSSGYMGVRSVEFKKSGNTVVTTTDSYSAYATSVFTGYDPKWAFLTTIQKTGSWSGTSWISANGQVVNQRLTVVMDVFIDFDEIVINNGHSSGELGSTTNGIKNTKITTSTDSITSTVYDEAIANSKVIFDGIIRQHVAADVVDDQSILTRTSYKGVKSVILDIADNWGYNVTMGVRSIEFRLSGVVLQLTNGVDFTSYSTSPERSGYESNRAFNTAESKVGGPSGTAWLAEDGYYASVRLSIVFTNPVYFDEIVINNYHQTGTVTVPGIKNTKISISTDAITDVTYNAAIANSEVIFDGIIKQHIAGDVMDDQSYAMPNGPKAITARSVSFDFEDNWGGTYLGARSIEFLDANGDTMVITGYSAYATSSLDANYLPWYLFGGALKTGLYTQRGWMSTGVLNIKQRVTVVFSSDIIFYGIRINNNHSSAAFTDRAIKNTKVWTSPDAITQTKAETYQDTADMDMYWAGEVPQHVALDQVDDFHVRVQNGLEYLNTYLNNKDENTTLFDFGTTNHWIPKYENVKSVVFDIADNWGATEFLGIRSVEFLRDGTLISIASSDIMAYASSSHNLLYQPVNVFDTSKSKVWDADNTSWVTSIFSIVDTRLIVVFNEPTAFDEIRVNNFNQFNGLLTNRGIKNTKITTSPKAITSTVYNEAVEDGIVIFDGVIREHVPYDSPDDQHICAQMGYKKVTARSVSFDVADNWGDSNIGIRSIEFGIENEIIPLTTSNFSAYSGTAYTADFTADKSFDTSTSKLGGSMLLSWVAAPGVSASQRITVVFSEPKTFDYIRVNNYHTAGGDVASGIKTTRIWTTMEELSETRAKTYQDTDGMDLYWSGIVPQHAAEDRADDFTIQIPNQWEFNPASGFAQCVYEDTGVPRQLRHPGGKKTNSVWATPKDIAGDWSVYSDKLAVGEKLVLNSSAAAVASSTFAGHNPESTTHIGIDTLGTGDVFLCAHFGDDLSHISQGMTGKEGATAFISSKDLKKAEYNGVKSVVFDFKDNWGGVTYMAIRSVEFLKEGIRHDLTGADYTAYSTSIWDPIFHPTNAFDTILPKIGNWANNSWLSGSGVTNQRLLVVFNTALDFDEIIVNAEANGLSDLLSSVKNTIITTSPDEITDTTYGAPISNGRVIFDGVIAQHPPTDTVDDQSYCLYENSFDCGFEPESITLKGITEASNWKLFSEEDSFDVSYRMNSDSAGVQEAAALNVAGQIVDVLVNYTTTPYLLSVFGKQGQLSQGKSIQIKADATKPFVAAIDQGFDYQYGAKDKVVGYNTDTVFPMSDVEDGDHTVYINADKTLRYGYGDLPIADVTITDGLIVDMDVMPEGDEYETGAFTALPDTTYILPNRFKSDNTSFDVVLSGVDVNHLVIDKTVDGTTLSFTSPSVVIGDYMLTVKRGKL